jgi:polysaccharide biosynthesis protein PslH
VTTPTGNVSRLLYISATPPMPAKIGPARRNFHVLSQLARFYDVSLLSAGTPADAQMFARELGHRVSAFEFVASRQGTPLKYGRKVWRTLTARCDFLPALEPRLRHACALTRSAGSFDAIVLSSVLLGGLPLPTNVPVVGDTHNIEFDVHRRIATAGDRWLRRLYAKCQGPSTRREERRQGRRVDILLATSDRDRLIFEQQLHVPRVEVVPNGIDVTEFVPVAGAGPASEILFTGLMSYYPNQQAVRWFMDRVFPSVLRRVPGARFVVVGAAPPGWLLAKRSIKVEVIGRVPDMRPYLARASVVVAPLLVGGGTRVKILEACAMGKPVVSTGLGAEGLQLRHGESLLIADDPDLFAAHVARVLTMPVLAARLGATGRRLVVDRFDWDRIGESLCSLLQQRLRLVPRQQSAGSQRAAQ